jgi:ketosteroid isomerase-like protein
MTAQRADGAVVETWSRGCRVFRRTERDWRMVHQHVSFPHDPQTGRARTDPSPAATS